MSGPTCLACLIADPSTSIGNELTSSSSTKRMSSLSAVKSSWYCSATPSSTSRRWIRHDRPPAHGQDRSGSKASEPEALLAVLKNPAYHFKRIGLEAGPLSQWLFSALAEAGLPVICVETRPCKRC